MKFNFLFSLSFLIFFTLSGIGAQSNVDIKGTQYKSALYNYTKALAKSEKELKSLIQFADENMDCELLDEYMIIHNSILDQNNLIDSKIARMDEIPNHTSNEDAGFRIMNDGGGADEILEGIANIKNKFSASPNISLHKSVENLLDFADSIKFGEYNLSTDVLGLINVKNLNLTASKNVLTMLIAEHVKK